MDRRKTQEFSSSVLMHRSERSYAAILGGLASLALLLGASCCFAQTTPAGAPTDGAPLGSGDLFGRVIANQKRVDANMNVYERVERVEIRKTGSDQKPTEVKGWRVFPAGTGLSKIPLTAEAKPTGAESYRAALEKLQATLVWAAETGPA